MTEPQLAIVTHTEEAEASLYLYYEFCIFLQELGHFNHEEIEELHQQFCKRLQEKKEEQTGKIN